MCLSSFSTIWRGVSPEFYFKNLLLIHVFSFPAPTSPRSSPTISCVDRFSEAIFMASLQSPPREIGVAHQSRASWAKAPRNRWHDIIIRFDDIAIPYKNPSPRSSALRGAHTVVRHSLVSHALSSSVVFSSSQTVKKSEASAVARQSPQQLRFCMRRTFRARVEYRWSSVTGRRRPRDFVTFFTAVL